MPQSLAEQAGATVQPDLPNVEASDIHTPRYHNQDGMIDPEVLASKSFVIVGAGAIGSFFTMTLAKMGARQMQVYDPDVIANHNIANQMYPESGVGSPKVHALRAVVDAYAGANIIGLADRWTGQTADYLVVCPDNMATRAEAFAAAVKAQCMYMDARMGAETMRVYLIDTRDAAQVEFYKGTLYTDEQAEPERCAYKSIIYTVNVVSGIMLGMLRRHIVGEPCPPEVLCDMAMFYMEPTRLRLKAPEVHDATVEVAD